MRRGAKHAVDVFHHKLVVQIDSIKYGRQKKPGLAHALDLIEFDVSCDKLLFDRGVRREKVFEQKTSYLRQSPTPGCGVYFPCVQVLLQVLVAIATRRGFCWMSGLGEWLSH